MGRHDSESPLSSMGDTDMEDSIMDDRERDHDHDEPRMPPAKRLKTNVDSTASSAIVPRDDAAPEEEHEMADLQVSDVSSDTSGSVPSSPQYYPAGRLEVEDDILEQVTVCAWDGCDEGDMGNMDELVKHIHNIHIADLQQTGVYTCESDALAKHMRTVHETEALRPSDPVPKSMQPGGGQPGPNYATVPPLGTPSNGTGKRLKIVLKNSSHTPTPAAAASADDSVATDDDHHGAGTDEEWQFTQLTEEAGFTRRELELAGTDLEKLQRVCRAQVHWATDEGKKLRKECEEWEEKYWREWQEKETLLDQMIRTEEDWYSRRQTVLAGAAEAQLAATATVAVGDAAGSGSQASTSVNGGGDGKELSLPLGVPPHRDLPRPSGGNGLMHPQAAAAMANGTPSGDDETS
ncbi:INO80 complex subunit 1 [Zalerion maritima]|uniref:INO80 complex subunit 1 n=1 Tax=Zalerion maritima TaxID=339359 RepID=A0AAD5S0J9_9PEZI|nr:INO80 complex subunit 1 [Zalerion maritima]